MAHLAVFAFDEREAYPTRRDIGAITDRRDAFPKVFRSLNDFRLARLGSVAFDGYTSFQLVYSLLRDLPIHLGEIGARMLESRVEQPFDEPSVVGEEQSPLAVVVEPTGGIHVGRKAELIECPMPAFRGELAEHAKRFVEKDNHGSEKAFFAQK